MGSFGRSPGNFGDNFNRPSDLSKIFKTWGVILFFLVASAHLIKALAPHYATPQSFEFGVVGIPGRVLDSLNDARVEAGAMFSRAADVCPGALAPYCVTANMYTRTILGID